MALEQTGWEVLLQDSNFQSGMARVLTAMGNVDTAAEAMAQKSSKSFIDLGDVFSTALGVGIEKLTEQLLPAIQNLATAGIDSARRWGEQVEDLSRLFGMTGEEASKYAAALNYVGVSVEEGSGAFNYLVRQIGASRDAMATAGSTYSSTMRDITESNATAMQTINADWAQQQADAADKISSVWSDLADKRKTIESNLADTVSNINRDLSEKLSEMEYDRQRQLEDFARAGTKIDDDAYKSSLKTVKDRDKDVKKLETEYQRDLAKAKTEEERQAIIQRYQERRKEIVDAADERLAEIEDARKERLLELEEKKKEAAELFEHNKEIAKREADERIKQSQRAADEQIKQAERAADKETEAVNKALAKQQKEYEKKVEAQAQTYAKAMQKANDAMAKSSGANPLIKALEKLHLTMNDVVDSTGKVNFDKVISAFSKLPAGANTSAIAMQLFGRSGSKFIEFLRTSGEHIGSLNDLMNEWGVNMSTDQVEAFEQYGHSLNETELRMTGIKNAIGIALLPAAQGLVNFVNKDILPAFKTWATENMPAVRQALQDLGDKAGLVFGLIRDQKWGDLAGVFWTWVETIKTKAGDKLGEVVTQIANYFRDNWDPTIKPMLMGWVEKFWKWLADPKEGVIAMIATNMVKLTDGLVAWVNGEGSIALEGIGVSIGKAILGASQAHFQNDKNTDDLIIAIGTSVVKSVTNMGEVLRKAGESVALGIIEGMFTGFTGKEFNDQFKKWMEYYVKLAFYGFGWGPWPGNPPSTNTTQWPNGPRDVMPFGSSPVTGSGNTATVVNNYFNLTTNSLASAESLSSDFGIMKALAGG